MVDWIIWNMLGFGEDFRSHSSQKHYIIVSSSPKQNKIGPSQHRLKRRRNKIPRRSRMILDMAWHECRDQRAAAIDGAW